MEATQKRRPGGKEQRDCMNTNREQLWQAYIDGELSAQEAAEFEASLSQPARMRLAEDMRFVRAVNERLSEGACPDPVWSRTQALVRERAAGPEPRSHRWYWGAASIAAAAVVAFMASFYAFDFRGTDDASVIHAASSVEALAAASEVDAGHENAMRYLREKGFELTLFDEPELEASMGHHRPIRIVGARQERYAGDKVTEVLFSCCGYPVKMLLAKQDSKAAKTLGRAAGEIGTDIQATRIIDGYLAALVSKHSARGLLEGVSVEAH